MSTSTLNPRSTEAVVEGILRVMDFTDPQTGQPELQFYHFINRYVTPPPDTPLMQRFLREHRVGFEDEQTGQPQLFPSIDAPVPTFAYSDNNSDEDIDPSYDYGMMPPLVEVEMIPMEELD